MIISTPTSSTQRELPSRGGRLSASAWAEIAFMYAPSAFARSSGSTVESTLFSPRPLCLVPASPRPLARTMLK